MKKKKKQIKKNSKFKKNKQQSSPRGGSNPGKMGSEAVALYNELRKHRLSGYHNSKYKPSVFSP